MMINSPTSKIKTHLTTLKIALFSSLLSLSTHAEEVHIGAVSFHPFDDKEHCEINPMVGYTSDTGKSIIVFKNSECNATIYLNQRWTRDYGKFTVGVRFGAYWSSDEYVAGEKIAPAGSIEVKFLENIVVSFLGEAVSLHLSYKL